MKYTVKQDIVNGVIPNTNGQPNLLFRKGDIITSVKQTSKYVFNREQKGIETKPTVAGAYVEHNNGLVFVPLTSLILEPEIMYETRKNNVSNTTNTAQPKKISVKNIAIISFVSLLLIFGALKLTNTI